MKYIVLGSLASGLLLYGMSLIYGATGSLHLDVIRAIPHSEERVLLITGAVFMIAGVAFKLGAAPFTCGSPDVYQVPRHRSRCSSARRRSWRLRHGLPPAGNGVGPLSTELQLLIAGLAAVSLVIGNLMAIAQSNLKRMLAFSTVSHIGFLLMGIAGGGAQGYAAALFYALAYAIMSTAAFGAIIALSRAGFEAENIEDFKGLNARNPWMAGLVLCIMASLVGIPPFLGFWTKLAVLGAAVNGDLLWLAILGVLCAVVGCLLPARHQGHALR